MEQTVRMNDIHPSRLWGVCRTAACYVDIDCFQSISYDDTMQPVQIISLFDQYLKIRHLKLEAVIIGGSALSLLGIISRHTRDCDVLHPNLPEEIKNAAAEFVIDVKKTGEVLRPDWLNNGPSSLIGLLPPGWQERTQIAFDGSALCLHTLGRADLLLTKLFALCDRGTDLADCIALRPTPEELETSLEWVQYQDVNPDWPRHVVSVFQDLGARLGHGI